MHSRDQTNWKVLKSVCCQAVSVVQKINLLQHLLELETYASFFLSFFFNRCNFICVRKKMHCQSKKFLFLARLEIFQNFACSDAPFSSNLTIFVSYWQINLILFYFYEVLGLHLHSAVVERWRAIKLLF